MLGKLINPVKKTSLEKLNKDVTTLAADFRREVDKLLDLEDELSCEVNMLTRGVISRRLETMTRQAMVVLELSAQLEGDQEDFKTIAERWETLIRVALPELGGRPWREVWASLGEGEQGY